MEKKLILDHRQLLLTIKRLCYELVENHDDFTNTAIIGLQPRGVYPARLIKDYIGEITGNKKLLYGELDSTFYRDDFRRSKEILVPSELKIDFDIEDKRVVLVDDVLYTGRSVRSALDALLAFGRPRKAELLTIIDRRYQRETPIAPDYVGRVVDTRATNDKVKFEWEENNFKVWLLTNQAI